MENKVKKIAEINQKLSDLREQRNIVRDEILEQCEFVLGEKVEVFEILSDETEQPVGQGFIKSIYVDSIGRFRYELNKCNLDGGESKNQFSNHDRFRIEKIG